MKHRAARTTLGDLHSATPWLFIGQHWTFARRAESSRY
jgi:hypothetical protein